MGVIISLAHKRTERTIRQAREALVAHPGQKQLDRIDSRLEAIRIIIKQFGEQYKQEDK